MRTFTRILAAVLVALASMVAVPSAIVPLAQAVTACEAAGYDVATCDEHYLDALRRFGIPYSDPGLAIRVGHSAADFLTRHPTRRGIALVASKFMKDNAAVHITPEMAVNYTRIAVHYYGPPGLERRLVDVASRT